MFSDRKMAFWFRDDPSRSEILLYRRGRAWKAEVALVETLWNKEVKDKGIEVDD
ncbi:MAG: hypothetical protein M1136_12130 [Chloroflexi bacterium]|nr:hypothetical protein [Chloroflexota bacterium]MCL5076371.1 hypothetical protein [Chloroflexota bacterium]